MAYEQRDGQGALFKVDPERQKANGPVMTGSVTIGGTKYRLAGWKKEGKGGRPAWLSLKVNPIEDDRSARSDESDSIPF